MKNPSITRSESLATSNTLFLTVSTTLAVFLVVLDKGET